MDRGTRGVVEAARVAFEYLVGKPAEKDQHGDRRYHSEQQGNTEIFDESLSGCRNRYTHSRASVIWSESTRG